MSAKNIQIKAKAVHTYINRRLPEQAKDLGIQFFKSRFRAQGWLDTSLKPWPKRKRKDKKRPGRNILMDRGKLRNSIRGEINGGTIIFGSDVPYAKIHNEGGSITKHARSELFVRNRYKRGTKGKMFGGMGAFKKGTTAGQGLSFKEHSIKMPQRQFMGESAHLNKIIKRKMEAEILKILK